MNIPDFTYGILTHLTKKPHTIASQSTQTERITSCARLCVHSTLDQLELPQTIRSRLGHVHCRAVGHERETVRILESAPVVDDLLGARIDGEAAHRNVRGGRPVHRIHVRAVGGHCVHTAQVRLLYGGGGLALAAGAAQAGARTHHLAVLAVGNAQQVERLEQGEAVRHVQRHELVGRLRNDAQQPAGRIELEDARITVAVGDEELRTSAYELPNEPITKI